MKRVSLKVASLLLAVSLGASLFAGCKKNEAPPNSGETTNQTTEANNTGLPITDKPVTLSYWCGLSTFVSATASNLADIELYKELEKRTGVKIKFIHPTAGSAQKEQFNLLIASGDYPDIIEYNWVKDYAGGPEKAISDGVIIELNDLLASHGKNLTAYLKENKEADKMVKTDSGKYYVFPFLRGERWLCTYQGPILRKDWLDDLKLEVPETIDEYTKVLKAFKEQKGSTAPLTLQGVGILKTAPAFSGPYGVISDFFVENGKVKYGPAEPGYKAYMETLKSWYEQGLLDADFASLDGKGYNAKITGSVSGATLGAAGGVIGSLTPMLKEKEPNAVLVAGPYPTLKKGEKAKIGQKENLYVGVSSAAITTKCKEKEIAARWLDYGYSKEGQMLYNFGIENVSYKMENGYPKYTDLIMKNPENISMYNIANRYFKTNSGTYVQDRREYEQILTLPEQREAIDIWSEPESAAWLPPILPTTEESKKMASIYTNISTYTEEKFLKFVMGQEALTGFDKYVDEIKKMGLEEVLKIQQAALDRYNKRQ